MTNSYIWLVLLLVNYFMVIVAFRYFRNYGLFVWVALASVLANIQVIKTIELFGLVTTLGNIVYGTSFLATDILSECYSEKEARKAVMIGIFSIIATTIIMQICLLFQPHSSDIAHDALNTIFSIMPRITLASITAYFVSQNFDVWFFNYLKIRFPKYLWLRNNASTMLSQFIDNVIFTILAFWGVFELEVIWQIFVTSYAMKWVLALCDTPVIYWARSFNRQNPDQNNSAVISIPISESACANSLVDSALG